MGHNSVSNANYVEEAATNISYQFLLMFTFDFFQLVFSDGCEA